MVQSSLLKGYQMLNSVFTKEQQKKKGGSLLESKLNKLQSSKY